MKGGSRYGAGRPAIHAKVEHCLHIDVQRFQRKDMLRPGSWGWAWRNRETGEESGSIQITGSYEWLTLSYSVANHPISERINIDRSPCLFGGTRAWFNCPHCSRRVTKLYFRGHRFKCRHCHGLRYASQSEDLFGRSWRKQQKLEAKLGPQWSKPKGMHHQTRDALLERIWACEGIREDALINYMTRIGFTGW